MARPGPGLLCPRCARPLTSARAGGVALDACSQCGGVWLDNAAATREFNLSRWLVEAGFTVLDDTVPAHAAAFYGSVDWQRTRAYALGLNGIYLNLQGRERSGSVSPAQPAQTKRELIAKLTNVLDPKTGRRIVKHAYDSSAIYHGPFCSLAPDVVVGYERGYRISDESTLGKFPATLVDDRTDKWAADHCMDPSVVPGVLLTNKPVKASAPGLWDLGPTILDEFGLSAPPEMDGRKIFQRLRPSGSGTARRAVAAPGPGPAPGPAPGPPRRAAPANGD